MPGIRADGKSVTAVRRKRHLFALWQRAVCKLLMENGADMRRRPIARQVKLDGNALPSRIGMRSDQISGNVASQNRDRVHADFGVARAEAAFKWRGQTAHERLFHR